MATTAKIQGEKKNPDANNKLPNLKICVENTGEESRSESSEEGEISDDEQYICVEPDEPNKPPEADTILQKEPLPNRKLPSPVQSDDEGDLGCDLDNLETFGVATVPNKSKNVEVKSEGRFEIGFDPLSKESLEKREERARRFGISSSDSAVRTFTAEEVKELYDGLGVDAEASRGERGLKLNTVHLRGVDGLNTSDIFAYFALFTPSSVDWIDRSSCNVVLSSQQLAAQAVLNLSDPPTSAEIQTNLSSSTTGTEAKAKDSGETAAQEETMEVESDPDELDLMSSDDEESDTKTREKRSTAKKPSEDQDNAKTETSGSMDTDKAPESEKSAHVVQASRVLPPGRWRVAKPLPGSKFIFMRFATKADRRLREGIGFTQNPGVPHSRRFQAIVAARHAEVEEEAERIRAQHARNREKQLLRKRPFYARSAADVEAHLNTGSQRRSVHDRLQLPAERLDRGHVGVPAAVYRDTRSAVRYDNVDFDDDREVYDRPRKPQPRLEDIRIERRLSGSFEGEEELDLEVELNELLRHEIPEKRKMRMYADEEETLMHRKRMRAADTVAQRDSQQTLQRQSRPNLLQRLGAANTDNLRITTSAKELSSSRQARRRSQGRARGGRPGRDSPAEEGVSDEEAVGLRPNAKYEKLTIQLETDDV